MELSVVGGGSGPPSLSSYQYFSLFILLGRVEGLFFFIIIFSLLLLRGGSTVLIFLKKEKGNG